jgi:multidrug efflux pump subunit AcrA (membrane-fusion protein)
MVSIPICSPNNPEFAYAMAGRDLVELNLRTMKVPLAVDERRVAWVGAGLPVRVRLCDGRILRGTVSRVAEKGRDEFENLDRETQDLTGKANRQVFDVEVEVPTAAGGLRPGEWVEAEIELRSLPDAVVVPRAAVIRTGAAEGHVYVADSGGRALQPVRILAEDEWDCAVDGLAPGTQIWRVPP